MVLATKVGQRRKFATGLLLTIVTFGIYAVYWNYRAHNEVYRQFELARESRDEGMVWYVLGLVLPPFLLAYLWVFGSNVAYLRERIGLHRSMTPGRLITIVSVGVGAFAIGIVLLQAALVISGSEPTQEEIDAAVEAAGGTFLLLALVAAVFLALAYRGLQNDMNELWDAYDARVAYLRANPTPVRSPEMDALVAAPGPEAIVAPLAGEVDALRRRQPALRALPDLDALVARAQTGDADAREQGDRLLADVGALLIERAELLRQRADAERDGVDASAIRERLEMIESALFEKDGA